MSLATVNIRLDEDAAQIYTTASAEKREKLRALLSFWLREFENSELDLLSLMDTISDNARRRGLTPDLLETLLDDNSD